MFNKDEKIYCKNCGVEIDHPVEGSLDGSYLCEDCQQEEDLIIMDYFIN